MDLWIINSSTIELPTPASLSQSEYHNNFVCSSFQWIITENMYCRLKHAHNYYGICIGTNCSIFFMFVQSFLHKHLYRPDIQKIII